MAGKGRVEQKGNPECAGVTEGNATYAENFLGTKKRAESIIGEKQSEGRGNLTEDSRAGSGALGSLAALIDCLKKGRQKGHERGVSRNDRKRGKGAERGYPPIGRT